MNRGVLPPDGYRLSELPDHVGVQNTPSGARSVHTLFAVLLNDVNRSEGMEQSLQMDVLKGLVQAWMYHAEQQGTEDVVVDVHRHGLNTEVLET